MDCLFDGWMTPLELQDEFQGEGEEEVSMRDAFEEVGGAKLNRMEGGIGGRCDLTVWNPMLGEVPGAGVIERWCE